MRNVRFATRALAWAATIVLIASSASAAVDNSFVPAAGGFWNTAGNWSLGHTPTSANNALIVCSGNAHKGVYYDAGSASVTDLRIDGNAAGYYGALWQLNDSLMAENVYLGDIGEAWHWMEDDAFLWSLGHLYVGYDDPGEGHFYLNVQDYGVLVNEDSYVGYSGAGDFDHYDGYHACNHLFVGQNAPGTYWLKGDEATSTLNPQYYIVVGNADVGLFEQTGGTVVQTDTSFLIVGLNTGGEGTYLMKGGELNTHHISIGFNGDGYFTQSGGTVNTESYVNIGASGDHPMRAWYKLNEADGAAELNVGGDLNVGQNSLAKYEQTGGTATVADDLNIYKDPNSATYSYVYLGTSAGLLDVQGSVVNHSGYYDQDGGVMTTPSFTNDSSYGFNLDNSADFRATSLVHNAGTLYMWRNATVRGELAIPPSTFYMCNFTNNSNVQMGNVSFNGGAFIGHMTNNGSFNYTQGDFSASTLTNYGTVNLNGDFDCKRLVNNASMTVPTGRWITATGTGYANAVENNGNLTMRASSHIDVGNNSKLVNNGPMYAGGANGQYAHIYGDVENNNYLLPCDSSQPAGYLYINGDFTASSSAELRIRLHGTDPNDYDRMAIQGTATLAGELDVRLTDGFVPSLGDAFFPVSWGITRSGQFNPVSLPALSAGLEWEVNYGANSLRLKVVEEQACPGDLDGDNDVDLSDLAALLAGYGITSGATYEDGDLDGDGDVDLADLAALLAVYGVPC